MYCARGARVNLIRTESTTVCTETRGRKGKRWTKKVSVNLRLQLRIEIASKKLITLDTVYHIGIQLDYSEGAFLRACSRMRLLYSVGLVVKIS